MFVILSGSEESFADKVVVRQKDSSARPQNDTATQGTAEHRKWVLRQAKAAHLFPILLLLVGSVVGGGKASAAERRDLVVFDFASAWDEGLRGKEAAEMFRGHARRRGTYTLPDPISFDAAVGASGAGKIDMNTEPAAIARIAEGHFGAELVIWGQVFKLGADEYRLHVRAVDLKKDRKTFALDKEYLSTKHGLQVSVSKALDELEGAPEKQERDIFADVSWRDRPNLVPNGGFEKGKVTPESWERLDGLTTFWSESDFGKCLMMDTNVLLSQYEEWRKAFDLGASAAKAPKKLPPRPPYYDTVGGTCGAHLYSDYIPIKQGPAYRFDVDYRPMGGEVKVFVKGYAAFAAWGDGTEMREVYRAQINLDDDSACLDPATKDAKWHHYAMVFRPTQPLNVLLFHSDFDEGATGKKFRDALVKQLAARNAIEMKDQSHIPETLAGSEEYLHYDSLEKDVFFVVRAKLGRGVVVWGDIVQEGENLCAYLRGMDVRVAGTSGSVTKVWRKSWTFAPEDLDKTVADVANHVITQARAVTHLRVKLDAYWPVNQYYFDNVYLTEEPLPSAE